MELTGEVLMNAPRERVWAALNDAAVLQACIPGCEQVSDESPQVRLVRVMVKMGPVRARLPASGARSFRVSTDGRVDQPFNNPTHG